MDLSERERRWTALMEGSLQGDSSAYPQLLTQLTAALRHSVRSRAQSVGVDADDVVQDVLLALHLKRGTWIRGTPVAPWVAAIARNKLVDAFRRRGKRIEVSLESISESLCTNDCEDTGQARDLENLLAGLNERQRRVVRAVSLEGYSAQETAVRLQMSEAAVRVMLHRSLKALAALVRKSSHEN